MDPPRLLASISCFLLKRSWRQTWKYRLRLRCDQLPTSLLMVLVMFALRKALVTN